MNYIWTDTKWIFEPDGGLRDIYIQDVEIIDWEKLIDLLNSKYDLTYSGLESPKKINKKYIIEFLKDKTGNMDCRTVTVNHENLKFNCHFFLENEIEFDIWPDEIKSELDFGKLISFMFDISFTLQKQITLTYENDTTLPLIKIDAKRNLLKIITEMEINHLVKHDNIILPIMEDFKRKLFQSATEIHKPTKSKENKW